MIEKLSIWLELRKHTTPIHWIYGGLCAFVMLPFGILAGWGMMGIFAGMEYWNDYCDGTKQGCDDWWESFVAFCIGFGVLGVLHYLGIIAIGWC